MILGMYYVTLGGVIAATYAGYGDNLLDAVETVFFRRHVENNTIENRDD